jgi:hypothetical protein
MILDNSTVLYIYPKRKLAEGYYETYGETCGCRVVGMVNELKYKIRKCRLDEFVRKCSAYSINYDDFNIATDYSSLREHVTKKELAQKAISTFAEKMAAMCEFDLRRVQSALESGQFEMAITPPVLKMGSSLANVQQAPNYTQYLGSMQMSSETASANDELYQRPQTC